METVAEAIADELKGAGVDRVFGLPGGEVLSLIDAIRRREIEFVVCRHESDAGLMAAVYGKIKGAPGVVITTLGPGASNLLLPVANSLLDREPLLAISAQTPDSWSSYRTHQRLPLLEIFRPITKFAASVNAYNVRAVVREAAAASMSEPSGPTYLAVSSPVSRAASLSPAAVPSPSQQAGAPATTGSGAAAAEIRQSLAGADRPVVAVGMGFDTRHAGLLRRLVDEWQLPIAVTPKVKGVIDESNPRFGGVISGMALDRVMVSSLGNADLILALGLDPAEIDGDWHEHLPVLWVLDSPWATGVVPSKLVSGNYGRILDRLLAEPAPRSWTDPLTQIRAERQKALEGPPGSSGHLSPAGAVRALAAAVSSDTIVTTDVGSHKYIFGQLWPSREPGSFLMSNGLSGMGYGLPAAIAVKLARPERAVLAVVGDGSFSMNSQELETARRAGASILVAVIADSSYSLIRASQKRQGLPLYGVDFDPIDNVRTAEACGVRGCRVESEDDLTTCAREAIARQETTVIEIPVRADDYLDLV